MFSGKHRAELDSRLSQQESIFGVKFSYEHMGMEEEGGHQSCSLEHEDGAAVTGECAIGLLRFHPEHSRISSRLGHIKRPRKCLFLLWARIKRTLCEKNPKLNSRSN